MPKLQVFFALQKIVNNCYNKFFNKASLSNKIVLENSEDKTHLQKFLIDIIDNLDKTRLCPFCNSELNLAIGYGYWYDEHIKYYKYTGNSKLFSYFEIKDMQFYPLYPQEYNIITFSDWYDHYVASDKVITIPKDMIFNNIQELDHYLNKVQIFS